MEFPVVAMVLAAAFCHALWNVILKSQASQFGGMVAHLAAVFVICAVAAALLGAPPRESWIYLAAGQLSHFGYYCFLVSSYKRGDVSLAYPILRGAAPPLATLLGFIFLREAPPPQGVAGIVVLSAGVLLLAKTAAASRRAVPFALATSLCIAVYSVIDAAGARVAGDAGQYAVWLLLFDSICFAALLLFGGKRREAAALPWRGWLLGAVGGALSVGSYAVVLYAYTRADIGAVAALREVSVLFAAGLGVLLLGEAAGKARLLGAAVVVGGAALLVSA